MKKSGYIVALLIEIILYTGAYVFNYFTVRRLGMNRYVVHLNGRIKEAVPIEMILKVGLPVLLIFCILTIIIYVRNKNDLKKLSVVMVLASICTTFLYAYYYLTTTVRERRAYYVLSTFFLMAGFVQVIKTIIGCIPGNKKEEINEK